jgi:SAM-dependent methyltransferase
MSLRQRLIQLRYALSARYRRQRYDFFWRKVGCTAADGWWLDLGGGPGSYFLSFCPRRAQVVLLDIDANELLQARERYPHVQCVLADGQNLPFKDGALACLFCNSVIEHVRHPAALASEIRRTGQRFFLQTPNGNFPLEAHSPIPIPFYRYLPGGVRRFVCSLAGSSYEYIAGVTYLSRNDLAEFFPSALIETERVLRLVKSFYVVG